MPCRASSAEDDAAPGEPSATKRRGRVENLRAVQPGTVGREHPATKHGATSEAVVRPLAARRKRTFLARHGIRSRDLDALGRARLEQYARLAAQVELLDEHFRAHGLLDGKGRPRPATAFYVSLCNSLRLATDKLETHLRTRATDPHDELASYLNAKRAAGD